MLCGTVHGQPFHMSLWADTGADAGTGSAPFVGTASVQSASVAPADISVAAVGPNGMPLLNSLPGAPTAVYLDFDGHGGNTPYDTNGVPGTYDAAEQGVITEAWRHVASYFSMFYTNVTTVVPSVPYSYSLISNSHQGVGYSFLQFPTTNPSAYNPSGDARGRQSGLAHEIGHNFSLAHQSDFDLLGNKTNEYSSGWDRLHGPIMGVDFAQDIHKWFIGHPSNSPSALQDDVAVIADKINNYSGGDGFRPDDVPNFSSSARTLSTDPATGAQAASGIIERLADVDYYLFTNHGGTVRVDVVPPNPSALDAKVEVYAADGTLVAAADASTNDQHLVLPDLAAGTFYAAVRSHGSYGDLGEYALTVRSLPAEWASRDVGTVGRTGYAGFDAATGTYTLGGGGADAGGTTDEFHFAYSQLTGDGSVTARVLSVENTSARAIGGVTVRETLSGNSRHATLGLIPSGQTQFRYRATVGGTTQTVAAATTAPQWVRLVRNGATVTAFRSPDGVTWTQQGTMTLSSPAATVFVGLVAGAGNDASLANVRFDNLSFEGDVALVDPVYGASPAPTGLALSHGAGTAVAAQWDAVVGATGYVLERSTDGAVWTTVGNLAADQTSLADGALAGSRRYFYRVSAADGSGRSAPSGMASIVNRPSAVTNLTSTAWTTSQIILNWRDTDGETGYRIERAPEGSEAWVARGTVGANVPSFTDSGLTVDTRYRYRVVPLSAAGDGPAAERLGQTRLAALTGLQFTEKLSNRLSLRWNAVAGATGYRVQRSTNGSDYTTVATLGNVLTYADASVQPVREYFYRVVGINARTESADGSGDTAFTATPAAVALPAGWQARDIGSVGGTGATGFSAGTFTVISSGRDIWDASDAFRFTYQTLVGNGTITARVATQEDTSGWAKAGVMVRETLAVGSRHAFMALTPDNGTALQWRTATGGSSSNNNSGGFEAPYWVRLVRSGNTLTGYRSADGVSWTQQGTPLTIAMTSSVFVGLAVVPGDNGDLATVTFNNVTLSNNAPTITVAAAANPSPVTGVGAALSVLGADDHGEPNLSYTWSATTVPDGAAAPTFSVNGTNAARSATATFSKAGTYVLSVRVADTGGLSAVSTVTVVVAPTFSRLAVTPGGPLRVEPGQAVSFSATPLDQFGDPIAGQLPLVVWSAAGGTIDPVTGAFVAPAAEGGYTVTATAAGVPVATVEVVVEETDTAAPRLVGAYSRKSHGGASERSLSLALDGAPTVEPRRGGPTTVVLSFSEVVIADDGVLDFSEFLVMGAAFRSVTVGAGGRELVVTLSDAADGAIVTVGVGDVSDAAGNAVAGDVDVAVRALWGDANGSGVVDAVDVLAVRRAVALPLTDATAVFDLDLNGRLDVFDLAHARRAAARWAATSVL